MSSMDIIPTELRIRRRNIFKERERTGQSTGTQVKVAIRTELKHFLLWKGYLAYLFVNNTSCISYFHKKNEIFPIVLDLVKLQDARVYHGLELKVTKFEMDMMNLSFTNTNPLYSNTASWKPYRDSFGRKIQGSNIHFHNMFLTLHTGKKESFSGTRNKKRTVMTPAKNFPKSKFPTSLMPHQGSNTIES